VADTTVAQTRVVNAAHALFARYGVAGTSLQMIADEIGVTKAAVYHQYRTKDEIVLAAAEAELARLETVIAEAEAQPSARRARDSLIGGIVELAVEGRRAAVTILNDPVVVSFFADHEHFRAVMHRLRRILLGDDAGPGARLRTVLVLAAISGAAMHPFVADLDDAVLREELTDLARRSLGVRG
jgi:AcrR family transcriptional regulator